MSDSVQLRVRVRVHFYFGCFYGNRQELEIEREKGRKLLEQQKSQLFKEFQVFSMQL